MAALTVSSGLDGFRLIQGISHVSEGEIVGRTRLDKAPLYTGLEAMAQLAALDVRRRIDFSAHAFLLKVARCRWPGAETLDGLFRLEARAGSRSLRAFIYRTRAVGPAGLDIEAEMMFGIVDYGKDFQEQHLRHHYRELFTCLCNATTAG